MRAQSSAVIRQSAERQVMAELISGISGAMLAVFMWGHMLFVGSILIGTPVFDWLATTLEDWFIAQPTVPAILALFLIHGVFAARKIPTRLRERRQLLKVVTELKRAGRPHPEVPEHVDSLLWIWQVRTGGVILVLGSFHLILMGLDVYTDLFGTAVGIESVSSMARTSAGLFWLYGVLLLCVEFHASVGLYRLAVKWGFGHRLGRRNLKRIEHVLLWLLLGLGLLSLAVLAGWMNPPLAFLMEGS